MTSSNQTMSHEKLTQEERNRIIEVFNDPMKILILFKIIKKPEITSKELKNEINISGTKIYYYLEDLEGFSRETKRDKSGNKVITKTPFIVSKEEKTVNQLTQKNYTISSWLQNVLQNNLHLQLYETNEENLKWSYILGLNISIALMTQHKREIELADVSEFKTNSKLLETIEYNNVAFVTQENFDNLKTNFKKVNQDFCSSQNEELFNILSVVKNSSHAFVLGAMSW